MNPASLDLSGLTERTACKRLELLARKVPADQAIVELGAYRGRTAAWLAHGAARGHGAHVVSVDPWDTVDTEGLTKAYTSIEKQYVDGRYSEAFSHYAKAVDEAQLWGRVTPIRATAVDAARLWVQPVGLLFHDAGHTADIVERDLLAWEPFIVAGGWVALHDASRVGNTYGVAEGAERVLAKPGWLWKERELIRWPAHPDRRGLLVVQRGSNP